EIHEGRKRIDITYVNEAKYGFFHWLLQHYICPKIYIECKNYTSDIANPELDQLSGRFSHNRGKVGILICRKITDKQLFRQRCKDTAADGRGFILAIDDDDLDTLCKEYMDGGNQNFYSLRRLWNSLID
ncbi:restriction endonuclease, partial [Escherichia coli]